jgi:hypothetical protein
MATSEKNSPKNEKAESKDQAVGDDVQTPRGEGLFDPAAFGALGALRGAIPLPVHFPQGSGGAYHILQFPTYASYNFNNSQISLGG